MVTDTLEKVEQSTPNTLNVREIMKVIPHRYPFLLVDRVTEHVHSQYIRGYKNVTINEPFFEGHFPNNPIMPGVLIVEAMAQLGCILVAHMPEGQGKLVLFAGLDNVRFRRPVVPGDCLELYAELLKLRPPVGKARGQAFVNGELACEGEMTFSMVPREQEV